ncbi:DUF6173 family protein [Pseudomonas sp. SDO5591_S426]
MLNDSQDAFNSIIEVAQLKANKEFSRDNPVVAVYESLGEYVKAFEADMDEEHEIGARLVNFGSAIQIRVQRIGYTAPSLITFSGTTEVGDKVQLIQHISQLSFLLISLKKIGVKPYRIGFQWDDESKVE